MGDWDNWSDELYHHGILGQRWGIRRYQNPDGSLTEAGKKHYAKVETRTKKREERKTAFAEWRKRHNPRLYTDAEIKQRIERLKLDKQYKELLNETMNGKFARDITKKILNDAEGVAAAGAMNIVKWNTERPFWDRVCSYLVKGGEAVGKITSGASGTVAGTASVIKAVTDRDTKKKEEERKKNEDELRKRRNRFYGVTSED